MTRKMNPFQIIMLMEYLFLIESFFFNQPECPLIKNNNMCLSIILQISLDRKFLGLRIISLCFFLGFYGADC